MTELIPEYTSIKVEIDESEFPKEEETKPWDKLGFIQNQGYSLQESSLQDSNELKWNDSIINSQGKVQKIKQEHDVVPSIETEFENDHIFNSTNDRELSNDMYYLEPVVKIETTKQNINEQNSKISQDHMKEETVKNIISEDSEFTVKGTGADRIFVCCVCQYVTKYKARVKIHAAIHKDKSEVQLYNCGLCHYGSIYKAALQRHILLKHRDPADIQMFRCGVCGYESKIKANLTKHELIHKNESEVEIFSCTSCDYKTKFKQHMTTHVLVHKDVTEVKMFHCSSCNYETKFKASLVNHSKIHEKPDIVEVFTCEYEFCGFKSLQKANYTRHLKHHQKKSNQDQLFTCFKCKYTTNVKYKLKRHNKTHEKRVVERLKCSLCDYQTRFHAHLENHIARVHTGPKTVFCDYCSFKTKSKTYLKKHVSSHINPENKSVFMCQLCDYRTHFNSNLTRHCKVNHSTSC